ncbi:SGNH/GDSL hydrolase family protein [Nocardioides sp. KR10-350]|uniref:SGNH/GDSL hydrolase family protein n=1 Tax=Nocardioides cheoyonin TaxID=3156615 RepID=UPI0032B47488
MRKADAFRSGVYAGGGIVLGGAGLLGVLVAEGLLADRAVHAVQLDHAPNPSGWYGARHPGRPVQLALLGDSSAAGYGMERVEDTPGAILATGVSEKAGRPVRLHDLSVVGARSADLHPQVEQAIAAEADVAVILVGANDVINRVRPSVSVSHLVEAVRRLQDNGVRALVGTCPDLGTVKPVLPPLRQVVRAWSRRIAAGQTFHVVRAGGHTVSLADILGDEFKAEPAFFFGADKFHPSAAGYAALAEVLLPPTLAVLGVIGDEEAVLETYRGRRIIPIAAAALHAVNRPGTELDPAPRPRGRLRRLWVSVRHFRSQEHGEVEAPSGAPATASEDRTGAEPPPSETGSS